MDKYTFLQKNHYSETFNKYGPTPKGVDWGTKSTTELRYYTMFEILDYVELKKGTPSVLDVGCGYGALWEYAIQNNIKIHYHGIDIVRDMINYAKRKYPDIQFVCGDFMINKSLNNFDFVICNGILTQKLTCTNEETDLFAKKIIKKMFNICNYGIVFNVMSTKVNYTVENLFYKSPIELSAWCVEEISHKFIINHSYLPYEYSIYLFKE